MAAILEASSPIAPGLLRAGIPGLRLFATSKIVARGRAQTQLVRMYEEDRGTVAPDTIAAGIVTQRAFLEPNVEFLANTLKRCLLDAQGMGNESDPTAVDLMQEVK
jgi:hypothetical protein